jgi:hypothetical protein
VGDDRDLVGALEAHEADLCRSEQLRHLHDDGVEDVDRSGPFGDEGRDSAKRRLLVC